jgi:IS4 transposase
MPEYLEITDGKGAEVHALFISKFNKEIALVADRGYADTKLYKVWDDAKIDFIVRSHGPELIKSEVVGEREIPDDAPSTIIKDEIMKYSGQRSQKQYSKDIRRVTLYNPDSEETISLMTNNFTWTAETVSEVYRRRWSIEEFFPEFDSESLPWLFIS